MSPVSPQVFRANGKCALNFADNVGENGECGVVLPVEPGAPRRGAVAGFCCAIGSFGQRQFYSPTGQVSLTDRIRGAMKRGVMAASRGCVAEAVAGPWRHATNPSCVPLQGVSGRSCSTVECFVPQMVSPLILGRERENTSPQTHAAPPISASPRSSLPVYWLENHAESRSDTPQCDRPDQVLPDRAPRGVPYPDLPWQDQ